MSDEIKLTTTNNITSKGVQFPETPKPQVLKENFASVELNNYNQNNNSNTTNNNNNQN